MKRVFISATKILGYIFAGLVILIALAIMTVRLLTPQLDKHRVDFENMASQQLGMPVTIEKVRAAWYRYEPVITLRRVTVLNQETKAPALQIKRINVFISIPKSIWYWKPVLSGLMIAGTELTIHQNEKKEFSVQGFPAFGSQPYQHETNFNDLLNGLAMQPRLILRDIDIHYLGFNRQPQFLTLINLTFKNKGNQHTIFGKGVLHQDVPTNVTTAIEWIGDKVDLAQLKAKIYFYVSGLSLPQWLQDYQYKDFKIENGMMSTKIWATWIHGGFHKMQSQFQLYDLTLQAMSTKQQYKINRLSGNIGWRHDKDMYIVAGDDILVDLPQHLWPVTNFYLGLQKTADNTFKPLALNIGYLDLRDVHEFATSFLNVVPDNLRSILESLKPNGALQNAVMAFRGTPTDWQQISLSASLEKINIEPWQSLPGLRNFSGDVRWTGKAGELTLKGNRTQIVYPKLFSNTITFEQLTGKVQVIYQQDTSWQFILNKIQMLNADMAINLSGNVSLPVSGSPDLDLKANLSLQKMSHLVRYLPMKTLGPDLQKWLGQAFLAGEAPALNAVIRGNLADFPFASGKGELTVSGTVDQVDLRYAPDWPELKDASGKLTFNGNTLLIDLTQGKVSNIPVGAVHAEIPELTSDKPSILSLQTSHITADFSQGIELVRHSPLNKTIGKLFADMTAQGKVGLNVNLKVPLTNLDAITVDGNIQLQNANANFASWGLALKQLQGNIHFTDDSVDAENVTATLFDKPFHFNLTTINKGQANAYVQTAFSNNIAMTDLEKWLKLPFTKVVQGNTQINGQINFMKNAPMEIHLQSDLQGVAVQLPNEFAKNADTKSTFLADIFVDDKAPLRARINYADLVSAGLLLERKQEVFRLLGLELHLGKGSANIPDAQGLFITGSFDELNWDKIKSYLDQTNTSGASNGAGFANLPPLKNINITAQKLILGAQQFNQIQMTATPGQPNWNIVISSPDVAGQIQAPVNFRAGSAINAQFSRLKLQSSNVKSTFTIDVKSLPAISLTANNVSYDQVQIGQINFNAVPNSNGLTISRLRVATSNSLLTASGEWRADNSTHLQGEMNSSNVSDLLKSFGFGVHNFVAKKGKLNFDLNWQDAPYSPSFATMNGEAALDIGKGQIVDVGQASGAKMDLGRMLSLFSLQTLPRRLSLDFSDLFQKGYSFDYLRGNFAFKDGDAFTTNTRFDGPVARIDIKGRIGFRAKDYDLTLSVTPYVTSSIPVAATILSGLNPVVGLAAMAVNTAIGSKLITYHYTVTGPWSNPSWESVGKVQQ